MSIEGPKKAEGIGITDSGGGSVARLWLQQRSIRPVYCGDVCYIPINTRRDLKQELQTIEEKNTTS